MLTLTPPPHTPFAPARPAAGPDLAAVAVPLLRRVRDALHAAAPVPDRWGVPPLFFFRPELQREWEAARPPARRPLPAPTLDLVDDAVSVLAASADARKAGRATPGLAAAARTVAGLAPRVRELAALLDLLDDEVIRVVCPEAGTGWRVRVRGVADVGQFHALLADVIAGPAGRGTRFGSRPDPRAVAVGRGDEPGPAACAARFRLLSPASVAAGSPAGPAGAGHWLFPGQPLRSLPRAASGERAAVLADAGGRVSWQLERATRATADLDLLATMTAAEVRDWVAAHGGRPERAALRVA